MAKSKTRKPTLAMEVDTLHRLTYDLTKRLGALERPAEIPGWLDEAITSHVAGHRKSCHKHAKPACKFKPGERVWSRTRGMFGTVSIYTCADACDVRFDNGLTDTVYDTSLEPASFHVEEKPAWKPKPGDWIQYDDLMPARYQPGCHTDEGSSRWHLVPPRPEPEKRYRVVEVEETEAVGIGYPIIVSEDVRESTAVDYNTPACIITRVLTQAESDVMMGRVK